MKTAMSGQETCNLMPAPRHGCGNEASLSGAIKPYSTPVDFPKCVWLTIPFPFCNTMVLPFFIYLFILFFFFVATSGMFYTNRLIKRALLHNVLLSAVFLSAALSLKDRHCDSYIVSLSE